MKKLAILDLIARMTRPENRPTPKDLRLPHKSVRSRDLHSDATNPALGSHDECSVKRNSISITAPRAFCRVLKKRTKPARLTSGAFHAPRRDNIQTWIASPAAKTRGGRERLRPSQTTWPNTRRSATYCSAARTVIRIGYEERSTRLVTHCR